MPDIFLVTSGELPTGEPGAGHLDAALADRGLDTAWVVWDDPEVDWDAARLVVVRSTWDYHRRLEEFLAWARTVPRLLNGAETFTWNADKAYLVGLGEHVPTVPTTLLDGAALVVKPRVGASGIGLVPLDGGPWVVQPVVDSVRTEGESSVYVFGGRAVSQFDKRPAPGELRVQEEYGGTTVRADLDPDAAALAERAVAATGGAAYARVDLMRWRGERVVSELELVEPGLYLDVDPVNAEPFAALVHDTLSRQS
ncbi:hypothetical protein G5V58_18520 [Nocardioides anomalus]|uniref:ATP-grasp domain-containing protein n=1 Tax=Nocardioides anomalus TaxID=2712223 RepID=A0A6G6WH18_9ACTN|nr:hypothetical protein [Nocardioides anomalus]QIG44509.1 hypothetical protein G5V58_18520 [Nocardioides anomalus]